MANEQHVEWLMEGMAAWNARREPGGALHTDFPDFSGTNLRAAFENAGLVGDDEWIPLARYDLSGADLTRANFTRADLSGADLSFADLTRADLSGADLSFADLTRADLIGTNLTDADLTCANFIHANLPSANFTGAVLHGAILDNARCERSIFTHANLTNAKLWEAVIFDATEDRLVQEQIDLKPIKSMKDLLTGIGEIKPQYHSTDEALRFYFRGESRTGYKLQPSVMREEDFIKYEGAMLTDLASRRPEEFNGLVSGLAQLVTAQHHGLKTRFLDISSNPLVALFHACEGGESSQDRSKDGRLHVFVAPRQMVKPFNSDTVSVIANYARLPRCHQMALTGRTTEVASYWKAMEQLVRLIQSEKPYFVSQIAPRDFYRVIIIEPQQSPERIRSQSGAFLVSAFHKRFEREEILRWNPETPVYAHYPLTVSRGAKTNILDELRMFNITRETLFPGLDTTAKAIMESYRQRQQ